MKFEGVVTGRPFNVFYADKVVVNYSYHSPTNLGIINVNFDTIGWGIES